jgi:hypothetical protein
MSYAGILKLRGYDKTDHKYGIWRCTKCNTVKRILMVNVLSGHTQTCGCLKVEHGKKLGKAAIKHGMTGTTEYKTWLHMKDRCYNSSEKSYPHYGGRGITVCDEWRNSFEKFYEYMGNKPSPEHSIHRPENDGNYEPGNAVWATQEEQVRNRRNTKYMTYKGVEKPVAEWCNILGVNYDRVKHRLLEGWDGDRAVDEEKNNETRYFEWKGQKYTVVELAKKFGLSKPVLSNRINLGWSLEKALTEPTGKRDTLWLHNGENKTLKEWCKIYNVEYKNIHFKVTTKSMPLAVALETSVKKKNPT